MRTLHDLGLFLFASWRLSADDSKIRIQRGNFDKTLDVLRDQLPAEFQGMLTFGNTRVGWRCYELDEVLQRAKESMLLSDIEYPYSRIDITEDAARRLLRKYGFSPEVARSFGNRLVSQIAATCSA